MMRSTFYWPVLLLLILFLNLNSCGEYEQSVFTPEIDVAEIEQHILFLADTTMKGRLAGSPEEARAANYIADRFRDFGMDPASEEGTFFQRFPLTGAMAQAMNRNGYFSRNVIGVVPGTVETEEYIVIGAHFDGQGTGGIISMDHDMEEVIHPSADDNASGTAGLLELAHYFSENRPHRTLVFVAFSGEELGLIGSRHFVNRPPLPEQELKAMINLDMIGRMEDNELAVMGTGTMGQWETILERANEDSFDLNKVSSGSGASDHTAFYENGVPAIHFFTGTHEDYHRPGDIAEKINFEDTELVTRMAKRTIIQLDTLSSELLVFEQDVSPDREQALMPEDGVTMGLMPDYMFEGEGMKVDAVRENEPAARAGVQPGDLIISIGGQKIRDIFEYMEALSGYSRGDSVNIQVLRNEEVLTLDVVF